jgi:TolA-binding protein
MEKQMRFTILGAVAVLAAVAMSVPAAAQMSSSAPRNNTGTMSGQNTMSNSNTMSNGSNNMMRASPASMTCQQMMDKAANMHEPMDVTKRGDADSEMAKAQSAKSAGQESSCRSHMQKVIQDRT